MKVKSFVIIAIIGMLLMPAFASAGEHERDTWYIGFGLGLGLDASFNNGGEVTFDDWLSPLDTGPKTAMNFKVGKTLDEKNLLGFDGSFVGQSGSGSGVDAHIQINNYFLMWTHFPKKEGFFTRLGGGLSSIYAKINSDTTVVSGYGALAGVGYAYWTGESFNLTVNLDHSRQFYSGSGNNPDSSQFTALYLGFDWY